MEYITPGGLASLALELAKLAIRKYFNNPVYDFPAWFYAIAVPVMTILMLPVAAFLVPGSFTMPTNWVEFGRTAGLVLFNSLVAVFVYNTTIKPTKVALRNR